jgi:hypothetical protein
LTSIILEIYVNTIYIFKKKKKKKSSIQLWWQIKLGGQEFEASFLPYTARSRTKQKDSVKKSNESWWWVQSTGCGIECVNPLTTRTTRRQQLPRKWGNWVKPKVLMKKTSSEQSVWKIGITLVRRPRGCGPNYNVQSWRVTVTFRWLPRTSQQ